MLDGAVQKTAAGSSNSLVGGTQHSARKSFTLEELQVRVDALALSIGSRLTASTLMVASMVVIILGAQSLLGTMQSMDRNIKKMNEHLAVSNQGLIILNKTMDSVPPMSKHLTAVVGTVDATATQVKASGDHITTMTKTTAQLNDSMGDIAGSTGEMRSSLEGAAQDASQLSSTITTLDKGIDPLVTTQHDMFLGTQRMRGGLDGMNGSLAYVIRIMNYIAAPPTGGGMTMRAELPKETMPPLPGIRAEADPVQVFARGVWPVYRRDPVGR